MNDDACSALLIQAIFFVVLVAQDVLNQSLSKNCPLLHHSMYIWHSLRVSVAEFIRLQMPAYNFQDCVLEVFLSPMVGSYEKYAHIQPKAEA